MTNNNLIRFASAAVLALGILGAAAPAAFAQGNAASARVPAAATCRAQVGVTASSSLTLAQVIAIGDCEIGVRTASINKLIASISTKKKLSADAKTTVTGILQNAETALASVKIKLDADTDLATAKSDLLSIKTSVRADVLVKPQARISARTDSKDASISKLQSESAALTAKVNALPDGSLKTQDQALLADLNAKVADAATQSAAAATEMTSLTPSSGLTAIKAARTDARAKEAAAQADLKAARADAKQIKTAISSHA